MIYLNNAATTPMSRATIQTILNWMDGDFGNPGDICGAGSYPRKMLELSRESVAENIFHCAPEQVIFTSGGSEGNSTIFHGVLPYLLDTGKTALMVSATEHHSVLRASMALKRFGIKVVTIPAEPDGTIRPETVLNLLDDNVGIVSVMHVNNETGAENKIEDIGSLCRHRGILFHSDCVQSAGSGSIPSEHLDFATVSAHKFHGPKGIGALYIRDPSIITPLIHGGNAQEFGLRGGTENVPGIAGMACAVSELIEQEAYEKLAEIKQRFYNHLQRSLEKQHVKECMYINGKIDNCAKILNLRFSGVDGETLVHAMDAENVCISAGSACNSHDIEPSHVLLAMGLTPEEARSSVRVSFSRMNTLDEVSEAAEIMAFCVAKLRSLSSVDIHGTV